MNRRQDPLAVVPAPPGFAIVQAHIFFRHGDRAPTCNLLAQHAGAASPLGRAEAARADAERAYWLSTLPRAAALRSLNKLFPPAFADPAGGPTGGPALLEKSAAKRPFSILTRKGLAQSEALGEALRRQYVDQAHLLPGCYEAKGSVVARSTAMQRTVQSCQGFLRGFCGAARAAAGFTTSYTAAADGKDSVGGGGNGHGNGHGDDAAAIRILVETGEHSLLPNFGFIRSKCPALMDQYSKMMRTSAAIARDDAAVKPVINALAASLPMLRSPRTPFQSMSIRAFDHFKCHSAHRLPTASGTEGMLLPLKAWASSHFYRYYERSHGLMTSFVLGSVLSRMRRVAIDRDVSAPKICLYSGHDTTIMPLLLSLGVVDPETAGDAGAWPPYSAHIRVELLQKLEPNMMREEDEEREVKVGEEFAVRVVYNGNVVVPGGTVSTNTGAASLSGFERHLKSLVEAYHGGDGDLSTACESTSASLQNPFQDAR
jgi:hypothetical protein